MNQHPLGKIQWQQKQKQKGRGGKEERQEENVYGSKPTLETAGLPSAVLHRNAQLEMRSAKREDREKRDKRYD